MKGLREIVGNETLVSRCLLLILCIHTIICGSLLINTFHGDPTIYLVYARNIARGDFFSFNPGEFSSGSTSPLWAVILSLAFLLPSCITLSKIIGLIFTLLALFATYRMSLSFSRSRIGSVLGTIFLLYYLALPGLLMYESSLITMLVAILIILNQKMIQGSGTPFRKSIWCIAFIWSAIPLVRPEATLIVLSNLLMLIFVFRKSKRLFCLILCAFLLSLLPSLLYFGYSYLTLGTLSVSGYCRAFALRERAKNLFGFFYSLETIKLFFRYPLFIWSLLALWGWEKRQKLGRTEQQLGYFSFIVIVSYILAMSAVCPTTSGVKRYVIPIIPFIIPYASIAIAEIWNSAIEKKFTLVLLACVCPFAILPLIMTMKQSIGQKNLHLTFEVITGKNIVEYINEIAERDKTILAYEVQFRFYLRPDLILLSMDGITDGKIAPYLSSGDISSFLWKYKPKYWLAHDSIFYRPFLFKSLLRRVFESTSEIEGSSIQIDRITFTNIRRNKEPIIGKFAGYRNLYELTYNK